MGRSKTTLSALYCVFNEEQFIKGSIELVLPYVDEVIVVDNGSTDNTNKIVQSIGDPKIKIFDYPKQAVVDMGAVRTYSLQQCTSEWFLQVDADEYYPASSMQSIRQAVDYNLRAISFRVGYYNLTWREGYVESGFPHFPDRLYKTEVVEGYKGVLPVDMTYVKEEYLLAPNKPKGDVGVLEYDNMEDKSEEHPKQPILLDANFYHLARTRGYNYEYNKWKRYIDNLSPEATDAKKEALVRGNGWVSGKIEKEKIEIPDYIPTKNIVDPKVSVIITNYNYETYVVEAIQSVLDQTVKPFEIIVVDDCSTDHSIELIETLPVTLIRQQTNMGVAKARNIGIAQSTGDYYMCLDADDKLKHTYIEEVLPLMEYADVAYADLETFGETNIVHHYEEYSKEKMLAWQQVPSVCAIVDRHVWEEVGGFDDNFMYEDWAFWIAVSEKDFRFKKIDKPLFDYRTHDAGRCKQNDLHQVTGFNQLRERFGITRLPDRDKVNNV